MLFGGKSSIRGRPGNGRTFLQGLPKRERQELFRMVNFAADENDPVLDEHQSSSAGDDETTMMVPTTVEKGQEGISREARSVAKQFSGGLELVGIACPTDAADAPAKGRQGEPSMEVLKENLNTQKRILRDLSNSAEELAKENVSLASASVRFREEQTESKRRMRDLEAEVSRLRQLLSFHSKDEGRASESTAAHDKLWEQLITQEVLSKSQPPSSYPIPSPDCPVPTEIRPLLNEAKALKQENAQLRKQLSDSESQCRHLRAENESFLALSHQDRRKLREVNASAGTRLLGAVRRVNYLVKEVDEMKDSISCKDTYIANLEKRLLFLHKAAAEEPGKGQPVREKPSKETAPVASNAGNAPPGGRAETAAAGPEAEAEAEAAASVVTTAPSASAAGPLPPSDGARKRRHCDTRQDNGSGNRPPLQRPDVHQVLCAEGQKTLETAGSPAQPVERSCPVPGTPLAGVPSDLLRRLSPVARSWRIFSEKAHQAPQHDQPNGSSPDGPAEVKDEDSSDSIPVNPKGGLQSLESTQSDRDGAGLVEGAQKLFEDVESLSLQLDDALNWRRI